MISIGFTGTREGFTGPQVKSFKDLLADLVSLHPAADFHHGDCEGADAEAHDIVRALCPAWIIHIHPGPEGDRHRAGRAGDKLYAPKGHFARNRDIVNASSLVIGVSKTPHRLELGGTWYTLDFAKKSKVQTKVIWPAGDVADLS